MGTDAGVGSEEEQRPRPAQECPFDMFTRTIMRVKSAAPLCHGAGSGLCSTRLQDAPHFRVALFTVSKTEQKPKHPSTEK